MQEAAQGKDKGKGRANEEGPVRDSLGADGLESLRKRMAGPSSNKAGLSHDQEDINRKIYEASKGSKFFENERKRDEEVTRRIERLRAVEEEGLRRLGLALADGRVVGESVEMRRAEKEMADLIAALELERDLKEYILHCDMDMFYAAVEQLGDPTLATVPFGVGSLHGVLTTCNYEARKYGVRSGMAGFVAAKLCPHLRFVKNDFSKYTAASNKVFDVFRQYDPLMSPASLDEAYLSVRRYCEEYQMGVEEVVQRIRAEVRERTKLTVSIGVAPNKMLAKICSDKNKPDNYYIIEYDRRHIIEFMDRLSVRKVPGIGRVTERILNAFGVVTCGDIYRQRLRLYLLRQQIGLDGLLRAYLGLGSNIVRPHRREERKTVGRESTFQPTSNEGVLYAKLRNAAEHVEEDLKRLNFCGSTVTLRYKLDTYASYTRAKTVAHKVNKADEIFSIASKLLAAELPLRCRLIGVRVGKLVDRGVLENGGPLDKAFVRNGLSLKFQKISPVAEGASAGEHSEMDGASPQEEFANPPEDAFLRDEKIGPLEDGDGPDMAPHRSGTRSPPPWEETLRTTSPPPSDSSAPTTATSTEPTVICPICNDPVQDGEDNAALNAHIDLCLNGPGVVAPVSASADVLPKKGKRRRVRTLDGYFQIK